MNMNSSAHHQSPWLKRVLIPFWVFQSLFMVALIGLTAVLEDIRNNRQTSSPSLVLIFACINMALIVIEIVLFTLRRLKPLAFLVMQVIKTTLWVVLLLISIVGIAVNKGSYTNDAVYILTGFVLNVVVLDFLFTYFLSFSRRSIDYTIPVVSFYRRFLGSFESCGCCTSQDCRRRRPNLRQTPHNTTTNQNLTPHPRTKTIILTLVTQTHRLAFLGTLIYASIIYHRHRHGKPYHRSSLPPAIIPHHQNEYLGPFSSNPDSDPETATHRTSQTLYNRSSASAPEIDHSGRGYKVISMHEMHSPENYGEGEKWRGEGVGGERGELQGDEWVHELRSEGSVKGKE
ncbi:MAG: hypothetical protein Q9169_005870 [Polycauliona sp. 2 TL-2023]